MKHVWKWLLLLLVLISALGGAYYYHQHTASQASQPTKVVKKHVRLVAIGDSLTYGQGDEKEQGGYVGQIKPALEKEYSTKVSTWNYGVSGDRSDQILKRLNNQPKMRQNLKQADVIVMTVGGNDLMQKLQVNLLSSSSDVNDNVAAARKTYQKKLKTLFTAVRQQNSHAPIFLFSIYNPVYTYFPQVSVINESIEKWNQTSQATVKEFKPAYFVNIDHLMSYGQYKTEHKRAELKKTSKEVNQTSISQKQVVSIMNHREKNLNEYISTDDNFHPNHHGYQQMTKALLKQMKQHDSFMYEEK
ncbi:SGNH/GDSL hydrolase family protein [Limosilactobacillus secaliphilus]|uniref:Lipolytic protein G-D-S-L family n=1 Tax=Limosilactobacillus secaliphilus TaxID=396268 RepID=A0A0R2I9U3_9LACO|nr:SGNH/GDSL hydrolase family protein [Limosilactobacillus secaliphilus]KRN58871.1 lipolytic protein G-D-S-L family [Limosilactobacillus secaliphilus]